MSSQWILEIVQAFRLHQTYCKVLFAEFNITLHCRAQRALFSLNCNVVKWGKAKVPKVESVNFATSAFCRQFVHEGICSSLCRDFVKRVMQWNFYPCSAADLSLKRAALVWKIKATRAVIRNGEHEQFSAFWAEKQQAVICKAESKISCVFQAEKQGAVIWSRKRKKLPVQLGCKSCCSAFLLLRQDPFRSSAWLTVLI